MLGILKVDGGVSYIVDCIISNSIVPHPAYDAATFNNDVVVLKLQRKVDYTILPNVYPVCWPTLEPHDGTTVRYFSEMLLPLLTISIHSTTSREG